MPPVAALLIWPAISAIFFRTMRLPLAIVVTLLAGYLLLPEGKAIDLPLLPAFNKNTIPVLSALLFAGLAAKNYQGSTRPGLFPRSWLARGMLAAMVFGAFMTVRNNPDPIIFPLRVLEGMTLYDAFSAVLNVAMMLLPMVLARKYLAHPQNHILILQTLCVAGLAYSLLALFEVRMSPRLNSWVYGFFQHEWRQHIRDGGFRPVVFLRHALLLAIFLSTAILAAAALSRIDMKRRALLLVAAVWLVGTLVLSKSLGALLITLVLLPVALFFSTRGQLLTAAVIAALFLTYPVARSSPFVPIDGIVRTIESINPNRAESLRFRLENEDRLLARANERPVFGWGGWGRNWVFDERGRSLTTPDGAWILELGLGGWVRYLTLFGLLAAPLLLLFLHNRRYGVGPETAALALILTANLVDSIPNASVTPISWLIAGALWGRLELKREVAAGQGEAATPRAVVGYRRPFADRDTAQPGVTTHQGTVYTRQEKPVYRRERMSK